uniref:Uncharacterized protein n=1 Tax=Rhizophagus irregularis (strain DAOM 181602 / DAOM 197198 / MUCL 43194) TaxID=747089 RepID=U9TCC1_RHIID
MEFFKYVDDNILKELSMLSTSIKKLELNVRYGSFGGIIELIGAQKNLNQVNLTYDNEDYISNDTFEYCQKPLEESLIKHADTIQYLRMDWEPITNLLSYLINLKLFLFHITERFKIISLSLEGQTFYVITNCFKRIIFYLNTLLHIKYHSDLNK